MNQFRPQWGGIALPADPKDRPEFVKQLLAQYTELQIENDPSLVYLRDRYAELISAHLNPQPHTPDYRETDETAEFLRREDVAECATCGHERKYHIRGGCVKITGSRPSEYWKKEEEAVMCGCVEHQRAVNPQPKEGRCTKSEG